MSLLNFITNKVTSSVLVNNRSLSNFTSTSYAQAGTSLSQITSQVESVAKKSIIDIGGGDNNLYAPITAMRDKALSLDSLNADAINQLSADSISKIDLSAITSLPGVDNSLYDIQRVSRDSIGTGVDFFSSSVQGINPGIFSSVNSVGVSSLLDTNRSSDAFCSAAYGGATSSLNGIVASMNTSLVNKAVASVPTSVSGITELPTASSLFSSSTTSSVKKSNLTSTTEDPVPEGVNTTDIIYQDIKLYVEGVQIPFESCSITQSIGNLPTANFQVPPQAGLMDIARYYQPKVHIFFTDANTGGDRLLFWGHIVGINYVKSQQNSYSTISFSCVHKNALMKQLTFEWSAGGASNVTSGRSLTDNNPDQATIQLHMFNSELSIIQALQGITGLQTAAADLLDTTNADIIKADPTKLSDRFSDFEKRMIGMPAAIMNMWNQVKKEVYANEKLNLIFSKMYLPLVEDGLAFFDRLAGHDFLENQIQLSKQEHCNKHAKPEASKYPTMLPPSFRMDILSANQTQMVINSLSSSLGFSGEMMSFYDMFANFYYGVEYDMITLASPAEVPIDPTSRVNLDDPTVWRAQKRMAIETIVKPQIPFYYAPICNVLLPNMFHTISVDQEEASIPTRITVFSTAASQLSNSPSSLGLNYRAPHSIRESISLGRELVGEGATTTVGTLRNTTAS